MYAEKNSVVFDIVSTNQRKEIVKDIWCGIHVVYVSSYNGVSQAPRYNLARWIMQKREREFPNTENIQFLLLVS